MDSLEPPDENDESNEPSLDSRQQRSPCTYVINRSRRQIRRKRPPHRTVMIYRVTNPRRQTRRKKRQPHCTLVALVSHTLTQTRGKRRHSHNSTDELSSYDESPDFQPAIETNERPEHTSHTPCPFQHSHPDQSPTETKPNKMFFPWPSGPNSPANNHIRHSGALETYHTKIGKIIVYSRGWTFQAEEIT